jgi:hypothetical protein
MTRYAPKNAKRAIIKLVRLQVKIDTLVMARESTEVATSSAISAPGDQG